MSPDGGERGVGGGWRSGDDDGERGWSASPAPTDKRERPSDEISDEYLDRDAWGPVEWGILKRMFVALIAVALVYVIIWRGSYALFAPRMEAVRAVPPPERIAPGESVTLGAIVSNTGLSTGAAFVVATLGDGVEVEGSTVDVPAKDSTEVTVQLSLGAGGHPVTLVVFDSWRGVRRLDTFQDLYVQVGTQDLDRTRLVVPEQATRGETIDVAVPWSNRGQVGQQVTPVLVFRPQEGGLPVPAEGPTTELAPGQERTLRFGVDTWPLRPGRYLVDVLVRKSGGQIVGRGGEPLTVDVMEGP